MPSDETLGSNRLLPNEHFPAFTNRATYVPSKQTSAIDWIGKEFAGYEGMLPDLPTAIDRSGEKRPALLV